MKRLSAGLWVVASIIGLMTTAILISCGGEQSPEGESAMNQFLPPEIDGWVRRDSLPVYDRETIFRYIDGAGEVYNSYAFSEVVVAVYSRGDGSEVTVELFDMGTAHDAYGVFSYARESETPGIGGGYEQRGGILCFWQNRYYACVSAGETVEDKGAVLTEVSRAISALLPEASAKPELVGVLPAEGLIPNSDRYFHVQAALNYNYYLARENLLQLNPETDAVLARYRPGSTYLVIVKYSNEAAASTALASFLDGYLPEAGGADVIAVEDGKFVSARSLGRFVTVVLDANEEKEAVRLIDAARDRIAALSE